MKTTAAPPLAGFSVEQLDRVARMLKLLAHVDRLKIVEALDALGEAPVHAIMRRARLPQAPASQHLNLMRRAGLVAARRKGREVWYRIADRRSLVVLDCVRRKGGSS